MKHDPGTQADKLLEGVVDAVNSIPDPVTRREVVLRLRESLPRVRWLTDSTGKLSGVSLC
jgi:hypothetical protein